MDQENKIIEVTPQVFQKTIPYKNYNFICQQLLKGMEGIVNYKVMRHMCKLFEFNEIEIVYWNQINTSLEYGANLHTKYQQSIKQIICQSRNVAFNGFKDFLNFEDVDDIALHKRQLLFLTLSGHFTLKSLRGTERIDKIKEFIKEEIFIKLHEFLSPLFEEVVKGLTIQKLNLSFIQLLEEKQQDQKDNQIDYNYIVDQIIDMAPAYAKEDVIEASNINKRQKKLRTKNQKVIEKQEIEVKQPLKQETFSQEQKIEIQNSQFSNQMLLRSNQYFKFNSLESIQQPSFNLYGDLNTHSKFNFFSRRSFK